MKPTETTPESEMQEVTIRLPKDVLDNVDLATLGLDLSRGEIIGALLRIVIAQAEKEGKEKA